MRAWSHVGEHRKPSNGISWQVRAKSLQGITYLIFFSITIISQIFLMPDIKSHLSKLERKRILTYSCPGIRLFLYLSEVFTDISILFYPSCSGAYLQFFKNLHMRPQKECWHSQSHQDMAEKVVWLQGRMMTWVGTQVWIKMCNTWRLDGLALTWVAPAGSQHQRGCWTGLVPWPLRLSSQPASLIHRESPTGIHRGDFFLWETARTVRRSFSETVF